MSDAKLQGRVAVVIGASQGIGQAITSSLTSVGVDAVMCSRSADALSQAVGHVADASRPDRRQCRVEAYTADVRDPSQMDSLMAKAVDTFGRLDILINNAGVGSVNRAWVDRLKPRRRETGEVAPRKQTRWRPPILHAQLTELAALIREQPDRPLAE